MASDCMLHHQNLQNVFVSPHSTGLQGSEIISQEAVSDLSVLNVQKDSWNMTIDPLSHNSKSLKTPVAVGVYDLLSSLQHCNQQKS